MSILLTGSRGVFGSEFFRSAWSRGIPVVALDHSVAKTSSVVSLAENYQNIDCVVHAAADTDVEKCERYPFETFTDNYWLADKLFSLAHLIDASVVFLSSSGVYGLTGPCPHSELQTPEPKSQYHKAKFFSEVNLRSKISKALVIRAGWIFGGDLSHKKNFVLNRVREAVSTKDGVLRADPQQIGSPTSARDLAEAILDLIELEVYGVFNLGGAGFASRLEYVRAIMELAEIDVKVIPGVFHRSAPVSANEATVNQNFLNIMDRDLPDWKESLAEYIQTITVEVRSLRNDRK